MQTHLQMEHAVQSCRPTETALLLLLRHDVALRSTEVDLAGEPEDCRCEKGSQDRDGDLLFHWISDGQRLRISDCDDEPRFSGAAGSPDPSIVCARFEDDRND